MAASINEPHLSEVDLDEDALREARARENEKYHNLHVHRLSPEKELRESALPGTPASQRRVMNGSHSGDREYAVDSAGQPATLAVTQQHVVHQQPHQEQQAKSSKQKRVPLFSGFGRRGRAARGEGDHNVDIGYEKNGAPSTHTYGQGHPDDWDKPVTLRVYPYYVKRVPGILRILQLIVGIIVCAAVNAERCISNSNLGILCASASSPLWYGVLGGQGFVLFVGIIFILGNFALIFYHVCTKPKQAAGPQKRSLFSDKCLLAELAYSAFAVFMYIIAASVESWYASWKTLPTQWEVMSGVQQMEVRNVYRPQWIAAAVFAWINVLLYAIHILYSFIFR